ncbi:MerR family transcriptional regulator [Ectothiorhodospira marina]|uniref:MerR HTH family regulatory protein n=1 Tax=Ectothiorhodospira marina TaxID=1396821 RepID=A0A1H7F4K9_9GAMM|nr:MerR family transcriptional regulator [Ectothiorhodospira marina]SEK20754.1 MerR HTH family regulatory protein [Ectothiorhodospira marina]
MTPTPRAQVSPPETDGLFPIRTVASMTGVHPVTLRAWERRHGLIRPQRTPKGHRLYSTGDIDRIRQVLGLLEQGISIGQVGQLLDAPDPATLEDNPPARGPSAAWPDYHSRLTAAALQFDSHTLERVYADAMSVFPVQQVISQLLWPTHTVLGDQAGDSTLSAAAQAFFRGWARYTLGCRFRHELSHAQGPALVLAPFPEQGDTLEMDMLALLTATQGVRVLWLAGPITLDTLEATMNHVPARGLTLVGENRLSRELLTRGLPTWSGKIGSPVFAAGPSAHHHRRALTGAGLIPLERDPWQATRQLEKHLLTPQAD